MSYSPEKSSPLEKPAILSDAWFKNKKALNNLVFAMNNFQLQSPPVTAKPDKAQIFFNHPKVVADRTSLLSDETLLQILSKLPDSQRNSNSLVSKRWLNLQGRLVRSLKLLDWNFLLSGRVFVRFPNLIHVDLVHASVTTSPRNSRILLTTHQKLVSFYIDYSNSCITSKRFSMLLLSPDEIDVGLRILASGCPNLRRFAIVSPTEIGLLSVAEECPTLQELVLHRCNDQVLRGIAAFGNLQILKLIASVDGFCTSVVSDIGLTILAQGCERLVKLELTRCEGSYDGIKAIGQCCQMLEELTFCDHRMYDGWLSGLSFCENLKTLRFQSCKVIDRSPGPDEHLGFCPALERLHLERCQLLDKQSVKALLLVCRAVREIVFQNCWGLDCDIFSISSVCRRVKFLSLEGCSKLKMEDLEPVILSWKEFKSLRVMSCNNMKDSEVTPALSTLFSGLKKLKWRPDTKSLLSANLVGTGMGKRGGKFFKKTNDWKILYDA